MTIAPVEVSTQEFVDTYEALTATLQRKERALLAADASLAEIVAITAPHKSSNADNAEVVRATEAPYHLQVANAHASYSTQVQTILAYVSVDPSAAFTIITTRQNPELSDMVSMRLRPHFDVEEGAELSAYLGLELLQLAELERDGQLPSQIPDTRVYQGLQNSHTVVYLESDGDTQGKVVLTPDVEDGNPTGLISVAFRPTSDGETVDLFDLTRSTQKEAYNSAVDLIYRLNAEVLDIDSTFLMDQTQS